MKQTSIRASTAFVASLCCCASALQTPPADASSTPVSCRTNLGRTVVANSEARVFRHRRTGDFTRSFGCYGHRGNAFPLGEQRTATSATTAGRTILAGRRAVVELSSINRGTRLEVISVVDLRARRATTIYVGAQAPDGSSLADFAATDRAIAAIASNSTGSRIAYVLAPPAAAPMQLYTVIAVDVASRASTVLDQAPDVDPTSLASSGRSFYWTRGGLAQQHG